MWVRERLGAERVSERRACQVLGQVRSTQRRERQIPDDEARLVARMVELATQYGRPGYPFNRTHPGLQFSRGGSLEGDPGSAGARAPRAAWATPPGAAWWR